MGLTEYNVSRIGFGCAPMGSFDYGNVNDKDSINAVRRALDMGINFFDTADIYGFGHSEEVLGKALGKRRNDVIIATKFGLKWDHNGRVSRDCSAKRTFEAIDNSLRRLKVDTIPLYQIHWPDPNTPIDETMEALLAIQKSGKIQHIGSSNFTPDLIKKSHQFSKLESLQSFYNLMERYFEKDVLACCREYKMSFFAHTPLARGFLSGKYKFGHKFKGPDTRNDCLYFSDENSDEKNNILDTLQEIAKKYEKTISQVAIRWVLDNPLVTSAIVGIKNVEQVEQNVGAMGWNLSSEDIVSLSQLSIIFQKKVLIK